MISNVSRSPFGLSNQTNLSRAESKELIDAYYESCPKLKCYTQEQIGVARDKGYVQTVSGRRHYLKDIHSRNAMVRGGPGADPKHDLQNFNIQHQIILKIQQYIYTKKSNKHSTP